MGRSDTKRRGFWPAMALLALLVSSFIPSVSSANVAYADDEHEIRVDLYGEHEGYSAVLYDNTAGLTTSEANAIAETSEGFIWIGSYSGLIRYDGHDFQRIDSTSGVASVVSLFVDDSDRLWIGTNDSGVAVLERGEFKMFKKSDGLRSLSIRAIAQDAAGDVYVATTDGISIIGKDMSLRALDDSRLNGKYVKDLRKGTDGVLYGVTNVGEVFTIEGGQLASFYTEADLGISGVISLLPDSEHEGYAYVGTAKSEVYYGEVSAKFASSEVINVSPLAYTKAMESFNGTLVVCADNGVGTYKNGVFRKIENVPLDNSIDHAMLDYEGNLWFTSSRQGVMKIVPNQFSDVFDRYGLESAVVNSTCKSGDDIYIGTDSGLTVLGPSGTVETIPLIKAVTVGGRDLQGTDLVEMLRGQRIRSIIRDGKGNLWFSTYGEYGLVRFGGGMATCFTAEDGMPSSRVRVICEVSDGSVLAVCTGGVARIEDDSVTEVYGGSSGIENTEVLTACEAGNGDIVLGSDGDGIYVARNGDVMRIGTEQGLSSDVVMRVKYDSARGVFWIITSNSIAFMDEDYRVTTVKDFPYSNNFDFYENARGEMWVLSSNGIYVVTAEELLANGAIDPVYYGRENGLPVIATANSYSDLTDNGDLYIAGTTGVAKVNIEVPIESVSDVKTAVPYVEVDGAVVYPDANGSFTIPAKANKLTVYPFAYTYSLMNPQVTYRLDGSNQAAVTVRASELGPIDYTNLRGGDYRFVMELHDSNGEGSSELSASIVKPETVRETLWFRILSVVGLFTVGALAVWFYFRRKTKQIQAKEQESRQLIHEMTVAFARVIDMKDHYTNGHSSRVAKYTTMLARELGYDEETVEKYHNIALLHDIGKIGVPGSVLNKQGKLTDEEFGIIKSHTTLGYDALKDISIMPELAIGAGSHHERPDGKGYPQGLKGEEIPRVAQIIAVADAFDAMYSDRPYRKRMNFDRVVSIINEVRGSQLTPDVVDAFMRLVEKGEFRHPDDEGGGSTENIDNTGR